MPSRLYYLANIRLPTEKAHGLQIMQNCEAFAAEGADVTLFVARRINTPALARVRDVWTYYGVDRAFAVRRVPCLDLFPVLERFSALLAFVIQALTYTLVLWVWLLFRRAAVYYSRDIIMLLVLSLVKARTQLVYEAHQRSKSPIGRYLQRLCVRRCGLAVAVTQGLASELEALATLHTSRKQNAQHGPHVIVAHDGYREARFAALPERAQARAALDLPGDAFIAGYVGRLHTMQMSKGVDTLVAAIARSQCPISLCLVGGPAETAEVLRARWLEAGLSPARFLFAGQVEPAKVPTYLAAFDVCTMPFPWTEHFAHYASPLKLFEYMAAGRAIAASDLPSVAEVVRNEESALLVPPSDPETLAEALKRLYEDPALRDRLAQAARALAPAYSWRGRARRILAAQQQLR